MGLSEDDLVGGGGIRLEPMAVGWGGLVGTIGLAASAGSSLWVRALAIIGAFLVGGFLSGVRTLDYRVLNAVAAWVAGWLLWAFICLVLAIVSASGGPDDPEFAPGTDGASLVIATASLLAAVVGAMAADRRYSTRRRRY
jgi:hypothetical protein